jgi:two-component system alkaline phosphatase synthesis response regulator PhoP
MKALIAEDDLYTRRALTEILKTEGWTVLAAPDGKSAAALFREHRPALVCLDVMMPGMSGYDVCREIRAIDPAVPVLFISAKSEEIDKVLGLELGADDFIVKPFGVREVLARIRAVLRRASAPALRPDWDSLDDFRFGPWLVRPRELRAQREARVLNLSAREVRILALLYRRTGQVVSREEFFRLCWELDNPPVSRTLDQHVAQLRKKIEDDPRNPVLICTVQGEGYRFE